MPAKPVTRTPQEVAAEDLHAAIRHELDKCPDDHDAMKVVPNRADRRRNARRKPTS